MELFFETERLIMRPWRQSDAEALYKYASDPDIGTSAGWPPHTSVDNSREIIRTVFSAPNVYAVVLKTSGEAIGCCGLVPCPDRHSSEIKPSDVEIGYWLGKPFWGKGLIPEAVNALIAHLSHESGISDFWIGFFDGNDKSRRVAEKCGFSYHHTESSTPPTAEHFYIKRNTTNGIVVRPEQRSDFQAIRELVASAFSYAEHSDGDEHLLVDRLRTTDAYIPKLTLVATCGNEVVGHIMFSKVTIGQSQAIALAPLAVKPNFQRTGIGKKLIDTGHQIAKRLGFPCSVVLGSPAYYGKAGYRPANEFDITAPFKVPDSYYMAYPFTEDKSIPSGAVEYSEAFNLTV